MRRRCWVERPWICSRIQFGCRLPCRCVDARPLSRAADVVPCWRGRCEQRSRGRALEVARGDRRASALLRNHEHVPLSEGCASLVRGVCGAVNPLTIHAGCRRGSWCAGSKHGVCSSITAAGSDASATGRCRADGEAASETEPGAPTSCRGGTGMAAPDCGSVRPRSSCDPRGARPARSDRHTEARPRPSGRPLSERWGRPTPGSRPRPST